MSRRRARLAALALAVPLLLSACEKEAPSPAPSDSAAAAPGVEGARANLRTSNVAFEIVLKDATGEKTVLTASGTESPGLALLWKQSEDGTETSVHVNGPDIWTTTTSGGTWGTGWAHYANQSEGVRILGQFSATDLAALLIETAGDFQPTNTGTHRAVLTWSDVYPDTAGLLARMTKGLNVSAPERPIKTSDVEVTITDGRVSRLAVVSGEVTVLAVTFTPVQAMPETKPNGAVTEVAENPVVL
ncbi:hypothetical protein Afil01_45170 [Actinorhabdospora filicis]|uniref:Lipoprotein n=1 Tax=Actinorhabdospora filicis TaxID=1785913 RepID=A0A9W6SPN3_9ACTN|nr:hypothetical protein [Actinorhabdospora filicis]GLZ79710.1 hypothetical protein Afil01_45170 [Actinorhabdospora filicis]